MSTQNDNKPFPDFSQLGSDGQRDSTIRQLFQELSAHFDRRLNDLQAEMKRLNNAMAGDAQMGQDGVITRLTTLEKKQMEHSNKFLWLHAMWWFLSGVVAFGVWFMSAFRFTLK